MADGTVAPGFDGVARAVDEALAMQGGRGGIAVAAFVRGDLVVDVGAGTARHDSLLHTFSAIKPVTASCLLLLVERGAVTFDTPVRDVWPELAAAADGTMLVRHVLTHQAGLASIPEGGAVALLDWHRSIAALETAAPDWPPGSAMGEHALTFGHVVGELVRRLDGRRLGPFVAAEIAQPLGLDLHIGLDGADLGRVVDTEGMAAFWESRPAEPGSIRAAATDHTVSDDAVNSAAWRRGEIAAVNGHTTARGLAGFWQAYLDGRLPRALAEPGASGTDLVVGEVTWTLGAARIEGPDVGMGGLGGQWGAARPEADLAWAFLTSVMGDFDRVDRVEHALVTALEG